ncbi:MAG: hypothetical protein ACFCUO_07655 [Rhodospirillales bacterium]
MSDDKSSEPTANAGWSRIMAATGSPLKLFALIVLVCNAVFAVAAASMGDLLAFTYALHMFLAVVASFVLIALWSPRSLYHPKELLEIRALERSSEEGDRILPQERPGVATAVLLAGVFLYGLYQLVTR